MKYTYTGLEAIAEESKCLPGYKLSCHIDIYVNVETNECFGMFQTSENNYLRTRSPYEFACAIARPTSVARLAEMLDDWRQIREEGLKLLGGD